MNKKEEILQFVNNKVEADIVFKVKEELDIMDDRGDFAGGTTLDTLYTIWKNNLSGSKDVNEINSWTAYALGLTKVRPVDGGEFLPQRRIFARPGFPDIDSDFDYFYQDAIFSYLIQKYGREHVGRIGNYGGFHLKSLVRRLGKAFDVANAFHKGIKEFKTENELKVREINETLPKTGVIKTYNEQGDTTVVETVEDACKYFTEFKYYMDKFPFIPKHAKILENVYNTLGVHAAGIVISDTPLAQICPLRKFKGQLATQYSFEDVEATGLIKYDILAIATLTVIQQALKLIKENYDIDIDIEKLPLNDEKTFDLYRNGDLTGIFQCENRGMQQTIREIGVDNFDDIMAAIALYRPGPMASIPDYCARKKGYAPVEYFHPSIEPYVKEYLERTYGILVYQESVMQICNSLGGMTTVQGYEVIKGIGKKQKEVVEKGRGLFIKGGVKKGINESIITKYWDDFITPFASYGFNAAHCLSGDMRVKDKLTNKFYELEELCKIFKSKKKRSKIVLDSYINLGFDGDIDEKIVEDELIRVFETGAKDLYIVELISGIRIKCTLQHKFMCTDRKFHTIVEIINHNYTYGKYILGILIYNKEIKLDIDFIESIEYVGHYLAYNVTMKSGQHNYALYNWDNDEHFMISRNSCCYGYNSYITAYLKANYPDEFNCACLNVETQRKSGDWKKKIDLLIKGFGKLNIKILPKSINTCGADYQIIKKRDLSLGITHTEIAPSLVCEGMGYPAAKNIEKKQPFKDLKDFALKTKNDLVDSKVVRALAENGFFGTKVKKDVGSFVDTFEKMRHDMKIAHKRGVEMGNLFDNL